MAVLAGLAETSGLLFAAGLLTPLAALGIAVVMLNAIWTVHWPKGFFNGNGSLEFPLVLFSVVVAVAAIGAGRFSIDNAIHRADNWSGLWWGVGVLGAAFVIPFVTVGGQEAVRDDGGAGLLAPICAQFGVWRSLVALRSGRGGAACGADIQEAQALPAPPSALAGRKRRRERSRLKWLICAQFGVWRSLVARSVRVGEVPSSNLGTPIEAGEPTWFPRLIFDTVA
jgi:DoxX